jgi:hypothetical protein
MVQVYQSNSTGETSKVGSTNYFTSQERLGKSDGINNNETLKSIHGIQVSVDKEGVITKGIDVLIGKSINDIQKLSYSDIFTVVRKDAQIKQILSKSLLLGVDSLSHLSEAERKAIDKAENEVEEFIETRLETYKSNIENHLDPLFR